MPANAPDLPENGGCCRTFRPRAEDFQPADSATATLTILGGLFGRSALPTGTASILETTSWPDETLPTSAYSAGRLAPWEPETMKNWLPEVPGGSVPVFAMATVPMSYLRSEGGASVTE